MATLEPGRTIVSASDEGTVREWALDPILELCSLTRRNLSLYEWDEFVGESAPYECS